MQKSTTIVSVPTDEQFALLEKIHGAMHGRLSRAVGATVTSFKQRRGEGDKGFKLAITRVHSTMRHHNPTQPQPRRRV